MKHGYNYRLIGLLFTFTKTSRVCSDLDHQLRLGLTKKKFIKAIFIQFIFLVRARVAKQQYLHPVFLYFCDIPFMRFTKLSLRCLENCFLNISQQTFKIVCLGEIIFVFSRNVFMNLRWVKCFYKLKFFCRGFLEIYMFFLYLDSIWTFKVTR